MNDERGIFPRLRRLSATAEPAYSMPSATALLQTQPAERASAIAPRRVNGHGPAIHAREDLAEQDGKLSFVSRLFRWETKPRAPVNGAQRTAPGGDQQDGERNGAAGAAPVPHYGKTFHDLLKAAETRLKPRGADPVYDTIREEFDLAYYLMQNRDVAEVRTLDPIQHYINTGAKELRDPNPHFNTRYYTRRNPGVKERGLNPFYHYLRWGRAEGRPGGPQCAGDTQFNRFCDGLGADPKATEAHVKSRYRDMRNRLEHGVLGEMVAKAAELDPLVAHSWPMALDVQSLPLNRANKLFAMNAIAACHAALGQRGCKAVIAVNRPRWGGGKRMEGHMAHALAKVHSADDVVVIYTDDTGPERNTRFPEGVRVVNFAQAAAPLGKEERERVFVELLRSLTPEAAFIVNSGLFWEVMRPYGKALSASMKIYACLFCGEQTPHGFWEGFPIRQFYRHFDVLSGLFTDSEALSDDLTERFVVPPHLSQKLTVLKAPVDPSLPVVEPRNLSGRNRPQVFWSGRLDRQKRLDVVFELARQMPDVDFRLWGEAVIDRSFKALSVPSNVALEGVYERFRHLPLREADAWLYTSEWDGVPSVLLEVGMTGVPIVGTRVGGTGEVLDDATSAPVDRVDDVAAYERGLREVFQDPAAARNKALHLRDALMRGRSAQTFNDAFVGATDWRV